MTVYRLRVITGLAPKRFGRLTEQSFWAGQMNFQGYIPAFIERSDQAPLQDLLLGEALGQPCYAFAFQSHGHEYRCKVAAEQWLEVQVIFFATQSVSDDTPQSRLMGISQVGQR